MKLASTMQIWKAAERWESVAQFYREALGDVPADLVDLALRHVRLNCKFRPTPAEVREPIARLLEMRQRRHADLARREADHGEQIQDRENRYNPDAEIRERAMAEIRAVQTPEMRVREAAYRSDTEGANARRNALREAFDRHLADTLQPPESAPA